MKSCNKTAYDTEQLADKALDKIRQIRGSAKRDKRPIRSYLCPDCGKYHLTSKENYATDTFLIFRNKFKKYLK